MTTSIPLHIFNSRDTNFQRGPFNRFAAPPGWNSNDIMPQISPHCNPRIVSA